MLRTSVSECHIRVCYVLSNYWNKITFNCPIILWFTFSCLKYQVFWYMILWLWAWLLDSEDWCLMILWKVVTLPVTSWNFNLWQHWCKNYISGSIIWLLFWIFNFTYAFFHSKLCGTLGKISSALIWETLW